MIDHVILNVTDYEVSRDFYEPALAALGFEVVLALQYGAGFGHGGKPEFWIAQREPVSAGTHVAFHVDHRARRGRVPRRRARGRRPRPRRARRSRALPPDYYSAFVLDPDGNNIEAVCHTPG